MRIGIDARLLYYSHAGIAQYILGLLRGLAQILDPGGERADGVLMLQSRRDGSRLIQHPHFERRPLWTPGHHRLEQWFLPLEIAPLGLDLLHSPDFIPPFRRNCRSVITVHDLAFLLYPGLLTSESARYYGQLYQAVRHTDHIIAVSQATQKDAIRMLGAPPSKISVVYEAAHPLYGPIAKDNPALAEARARYGIDRPYLLFVSTIEPRKNLPTLLQAFARLLAEYRPELSLVVVGERGWQYEQVAQRVEELQLQRAVVFTGRVPSEDLVLLYNAAELLAHPAYYEGFGLPVLEAMACGTPVVCSDTSALPEVVGDAALRLDPLDVEGWTNALWRTLNDGELRRELARKGPQRARLFSWEKAAQETWEVYRRVVA